MNHYDVETWSDFVRGAMADSQVAEMRRHLDEGCDLCAGRFAALAAVTRLVENERRLGLPPGIERSVKALHGQPLSSEAPGRLSERLQLVFDSRLAPAASGTRGGDPGEPRQMIFMSADLSLDLCLEDRDGGSHVFGEIIEREGGHLAGAPVALLADGAVVDEGSTGERGEFDLRATSGGALRLRIELEERLDLELPEEP